MQRLLNGAGQSESIVQHTHSGRYGAYTNGAKQCHRPAVQGRAEPEAGPRKRTETGNYQIKARNSGARHMGVPGVMLKASKKNW